MRYHVDLNHTKGLGDDHCCSVRGTVDDPTQDDYWVEADNQEAAEAAAAALVRRLAEERPEACPGCGCTYDSPSAWVDSVGVTVKSEEVRAMEAMLRTYGPTFYGTDPAAVAADWIDHDFTRSEADDWCEIGVWDAGTAAAFRDAGLQPYHVEKAVAGREDDPIYAACNGDLDPKKIIDVATGQTDII